MTKSEKSDLIKAKISDFIRVNSFRTDFLNTPIKTFTNQALLYRHFDLKRHIQIETDVLEYIIYEVLIQITLDQDSSNYMIHKISNLLSLKLFNGILQSFFLKKLSILRLNTKLIIKNSRLLLKLLGLSATILKVANIRFLFSLTITISINI